MSKISAEQHQLNLERAAYGSKVSLVGLIVNLLITIAKAIAGWLTGSVAITSDAFHGFTDSVSSLISLISFKLGSRPADKQHPFGHTRMEYILSAAVGGVIIAVGAQLLIQSVEKIISPSQTDSGLASNLILGGSVLAKLGLFGFFYYSSRKINSAIIKAAAIDSITDALTTSAVLVSMLVETWLGWRVDGIIGVILVVMILRTATIIIKQAADTLLGARPSPEVMRQIKRHIKPHAQIKNCHNFIALDCGPGQIYITFDLTLEPQLNFMEAHQIAEAIEASALADGLQLSIRIQPAE